MVSASPHGALAKKGGWVGQVGMSFSRIVERLPLLDLLQQCFQFRRPEKRAALVIGNSAYVGAGALISPRTMPAQFTRSFKTSASGLSCP